MLDGMRRRTSAALAASASLAAGAAGAAAVAAGRGTGSGSLPELTGVWLTVHEAEEDRITLTRAPESLRPGLYGIEGRSCRAVIGPVLDIPRGTGTVVRSLENVEAGRVTRGAPVLLTPRLYTGDPATALGIPYRDVGIPAPRGTLPAWFVPGARDTWIIGLHGLGAGREHLLNILPFLHGRRFPVLLPARREDGTPGARLAGLLTGGASAPGEPEWHDADAALRYAVRNGARRLALYGWSAGGATALFTAARSPLRGWLGALVLDSAVLDPAATLHVLAARRGVPAPLRTLWAGGAGHAPARPPQHPTGPGGSVLPLLVLHGSGDRLAPWDAARALADRHPEAVMLHTVRDGAHAALWNTGPDGYEETLRRFLTPLM